MAYDPRYWIEITVSGDAVSRHYDWFIRDRSTGGIVQSGEGSDRASIQVAQQILYDLLH